MLSEQSPALKRAYSEVVRISQDPAARELYEAREKALKDMNSVRASAIEKGIEQGIEQNKKSTVKIAYKMGLSLEQTLKLTGLSFDEVKQIYENMQKT